MTNGINYKSKSDVVKEVNKNSAPFQAALKTSVFVDSLYR